MYQRIYKCNHCDKIVAKQFKDGARSKHEYPHSCGGTLVKVWPLDERTVTLGQSKENEN